MNVQVTDGPSFFGERLTETATSHQDIARLIADPAYGVIFTDHMVTIRWTEEKGWHDAMLGPREPFQIDPACSVLHYAQEIFEGLKAYRGPAGDIYLFRPLSNARRFNESAWRMSMPSLPEPLFLEAIERLVRQERAWIPGGDGSLYLRPFMFALEPFLGVRPARDFMFCVIASPVGAYFPNGVKPISVWVASSYSRAADGGTGAAKTGGNYAASLIAQTEAYRHGCDQVLFLDASEHRWIEELGGMNIFLRLDDGSLVTPPLGTILPGITRDSVIRLALQSGLTVTERRYSKDDMLADIASGRIIEAFACGTAAVVTPIGSFRSDAGDAIIGDGLEGSTTRALRDSLVAIQRGNARDDLEWRHTVP